MTSVMAFSTELIEFNPGVVTLDSPVFVIKSNVVIDGSKNSMVRLADKSNCPMIVIGDPVEPPRFYVENVLIKNLFLDGRHESQTSEYFDRAKWLRNNCITIRHARNVTIENVITAGARSGGIVVERGSSNVIINGFNSFGNFFDGFAMCESTNVTVMNAILHNNIAAGISMDWRSNNNKFINIEFERNYDCAIFMRDSNYNMFYELKLNDSGIYINQRDTDINSGASNNNFINVTKVPVLIGAPSCKNNQFLFR